MPDCIRHVIIVPNTLLHLHWRDGADQMTTLLGCKSLCFTTAAKCKLLETLQKQNRALKLMTRAESAGAAEKKLLIRCTARRPGQVSQIKCTCCVKQVHAGSDWTLKGKTLMMDPSAVTFAFTSLRFAPPFCCFWSSLLWQTSFRSVCKLAGWAEWLYYALNERAEK